MYSQRRSIGAFVGVAIDKNGYRLTCESVPVEARRELICKNFEATSVASSSTSVESGEEEKTKVALEAPEITSGNQLQKFVEDTCKKLNIKPHTIIVYRDGVAESQLQAAKESEVPQIRRACKDAKLIYTVVQKRISTRFLMQTGNGDTKNPAPGVVVDSDIKSVVHDDFYLIPTECSLSTVIPVRYVILENDKSLPKQEFLQLTYNLCHCYPNWTGSVKLPLPTQMAHKMAYLVGETKMKDPKLHESLFQSCFYL